MVYMDATRAIFVLEENFPEITDKDFHEEFFWVKIEKVDNDYKITRVIVAEWKDGKVIIH